jgi:hypothetical protein
MVCAATAVLAACGSAAADDREVASLSTAAGDETTDSSNATDDASDTTAVVDPSEGPLQFAKCMREHGIDMPDPTISDDGGVMVQIGGPGGSGESGESGGALPDPKEMEAAHKDCQHFLADATEGFEPPSEEDQKKMQEQALAFSKCMREHGIDIPDPQFSAEGGGFNVSIGSPDGGGSDDGPPIDFDSDEFEAASEACGREGGGFVVSAGPVGG